MANEDLPVLRARNASLVFRRALRLRPPTPGAVMSDQNDNDKITKVIRESDSDHTGDWGSNPRVPAKDHAKVRGDDDEEGK